MANGRVITGYSKPKVAKYVNTNGTITYTDKMALARGVNVSISLETGDAVNFFADNVTAESAGGVFTGGTVTLVIDGLKDNARKFIMGLPTETSVTVDGESVKVQDYDDRQAIPYVGIGFVIRVMEEGVTSYIPYVLTKSIFDEDGLEAATQGENIEFQTTELTATILRDDSANHRWRRVAEAQTSESAAEAVLDVLLA